MRGQSESLKVSSSFLYIFFLFYGFFFFSFSFLMLEKKKMPRESVWNRRVEARTKSENVERELKGKFLPFFAFFSYLWFFFLCVFFSFLMLEKKKMLGENVWNKRAKVGGQNQEPKMRGQSESLKESSLPSLHFFLLYGFFFLCFFFPLCLRRRRCQEKAFETKGQKREPKMRR